MRTEICEAIDRVFSTSSFILGPEVTEFEREFAAFCEARYCVGLNNGTSALHLALLAAGIGPGDEVITQANTFIATVAAILQTGARPVLVDIAPPHYGISVEAVAAAITSKTRVILPVHLFGHPCDLDGLANLARRHGIRLIEDASQAHGATYRNRTIGSGALATFSFYPGKNLGAAGEAGAVVTNDETMAQEMRLLRNHGSAEKYVHLRVGYNYRMEGLQAAILRVKLRHLAEWTQARRDVAATYDRLLGNIERPAVPPDCQSAYHIYPVFVPQRDAAAARLRDRGIETNVHYPIPCHLQPGFSSLGYSRGDFPHAEYLAKHELSLPIFPGLTHGQIEAVAQELRAAVTA